VSSLSALRSSFRWALSLRDNETSRCSGGQVRASAERPRRGQLDTFLNGRSIIDLILPDLGWPGQL